ncbi:type II CRISPR RNA-guided endonuclease Cas9 [Cloacibacillus porcorum]|uniref:type II CRISPR RNA-guided endonuclease Cas9 n=1 Tax=Cloacibacillus porcorum TaxID=1197717 RepID=UPI003C6CC43C
MNSSALERYLLGLDIGITSVGWAVLDLTRGKIADLGVRLFDRAEEPKTGASLAAPRREARSTRRRLRRKRQRMSDIRSLIVSHGILSQTDMDNLFNSPHPCTPWELRAEGLDRLLTCEEWSRVLIHMAKHRGFKSNRTVAESDIKKQRGRQGSVRNKRKQRTAQGRQQWRRLQDSRGTHPKRP